MRRQYAKGQMWLNHDDLDNEELSGIKDALFGKDMLFERLSIDPTKIKSVQQYEWIIEADEYKKCKDLTPSKYLTSPKYINCQQNSSSISEYVQSPLFTFIVDEECTVQFHFKFYGEMDGDNPCCGIFVEIDEMPENMERLRIEVDMKCNEKKAYRQLMREQILTQTKRVCGINVFEQKELSKNSSLHWVFGVKMFKISMTGTEQEEIDEMRCSRLQSLFGNVTDCF